MTKIRILSGALAALTLVGAMAAPASAGEWAYGPYGARYYRGGGGAGAAAALGVLGGLAVGGAIAASQRPVYAGPAPVYAPPPVVEEEACYVQHVREWVPGWGWQMRRRTICD